MQLTFEFLEAAAPERPPRIHKRPSERSTAALERLAGIVLGPLRRQRLTRLREFRVVWNGRLRSTLGRADYRAAAIELNPELLDRNPGELVPTLIHELCHLAAGVRAGHGAKWKALMVAAGFPPTVCHRLDLSHLGNRSRPRRYLWLCRRCGETYPRTRPDARRYRCGSCGGGLKVLEVPGNPSRAWDIRP
ncbi:MAG: SprT-like domain-containing protein [Thermoanaerobaculia bacterium]